jgi:hypothetical protein
MRVECTELAVYHTGPFDLFKSRKEQGVSCSDVDTIARPQRYLATAFLGDEAEAIPLGLEATDSSDSTTFWIGS